MSTPEFQSDFIRIQSKFTANVREPSRFPLPEGVAQDRMSIYQEMVLKNIHSTLSRAFPIMRSLYEDEMWMEIMQDFLAIHKPKRPTRHGLPEEFLHYLSYVRNTPEDPPWLYELAHYEWVELAIDLSPMSLADVPHRFEGNLLNDIPVVSPLAWLLLYKFPVHIIKPGVDLHTEHATPTYLIAYRNWQDKVDFLRINDYTYALLHLLQQDDNVLTGREALMELVSISDHPNPQTVIQGGGLLLDDLRERHIILGTKPW